MSSSRTVLLLVMGVLLWAVVGVAQESDGQPDGADLGAEILRDKYILGLSQALKAEDYPKALGFIEKLDAVGGDLPLAVEYFRGEAYFHTGRYAEANRALNRYVAQTGREGRYYRKSLELMLVAEEQAKTEAEAQAARSRIDAIIKEFAAKAEEDDTPLLHYAVRRNALEVVAELIARGADVNAVNKHGTPPLLFARGDKYFEMVRLLIDSGADVDATSKDGTTALIRAADRNALEVARLLIDRGAQINEGGGVYHDGWTPLHSAADGHSYEVAELLIDRGADVNARSRLTQRPLCRVYKAVGKSGSSTSEMSALLRRHGGTCKNAAICSRHRC